MKRNKDCRSDMQLVPEQPFVLQGKTGKWTHSVNGSVSRLSSRAVGKDSSNAGWEGSLDVPQASCAHSC